MAKDLGHWTIQDLKDLSPVNERLIVFSNNELFEAQREIEKKIESLRADLESYILNFTSKKFYYCETGDPVNKEYFLKDGLNIEITKDNFTRNIKAHKYSVEKLTEFFNIIEKETYQLTINN
jgi:hypothetical protein